MKCWIIVGSDSARNQSKDVKVPKAKNEDLLSFMTNINIDLRYDIIKFCTE